MKEAKIVKIEIKKKESNKQKRKIKNRIILEQNWQNKRLAHLKKRCMLEKIVQN